MVIYREGVAKKEYPPIPVYDPKFAAIQSAKYELMVKPLKDPSLLAGARPRRRTSCGVRSRSISRPANWRSS
ncbi:MAG: hypothetical protein MZU79_02890 [Anaerotruncus sp.]|nr:hypothetical protein [Anaerotruncus sp.]